MIQEDGTYRVNGKDRQVVERVMRILEGIEEEWQLQAYLRDCGFYAKPTDFVGLSKGLNTFLSILCSLFETFYVELRYYNDQRPCH